jgi:hypothetical protein
MALAKNQKQLPCINLHASSWQPMGVIILCVAVRNWYPDKPVKLPNKLIKSEMSELKLCSDSEIRK